MIYIYGSQKSQVYIHPVELNMRQRRWLEMIKDYELEIHYHLGKANVVLDTLSTKSEIIAIPAHPMPYE